MIVTSSGEINKVIRKIINPTLKENGFSQIKGRTAWGWHDEYIWVFKIKAIGAYHASVTGWTASSLAVELGICYKILPDIGTVKKDENGTWYPVEWQCHRRAELTCSYDQLQYTKDIWSTNPREKTRTDIWWIQPDGSNIFEVVSDINKRFLKHAVKWFKEKSNKEIALQEITNFNGSHFDLIEKDIITPRYS